MAYVAPVSVVAPVTTIVVRPSPLYAAWGCGNPEIGPLDRSDYSLHLQPFMARETFENIIDDINRIYKESIGHTPKRAGIFVLSVFILVAIAMFVSFRAFASSGGGSDFIWFPFVLFAILFVVLIVFAIYSRRVHARALQNVDSLLQTVNARLSPYAHLRVVVIEHHHHHYHHHRRQLSWVLEIDVGGAATTIAMPPPAPYGVNPAQPGYPLQYPTEYPPSFPTAQPSFPYPAQPGYPPQAQPGYPPQTQPGYPPQTQLGYPPQDQPSYPAQTPFPFPEGQPQQVPQYSETIDEGFGQKF